MGLSENRCSPNSKNSFAGEMLGQLVADEFLRAIQFHWRHEFAVGQLGKTESFAGDSSELLHVVVPGRDVFVADWPIDTDSVAHIRFEVQIAPAVALAAPCD